VLTLVLSSNISNYLLDTKKITRNTRYHGVELGQVSCGKQTFRCEI